MNSNKCILPLLLLFCLAVQQAHAQKAKLIDATEQCWSGGIAGRHGCNYTFTIDFVSNAAEIQADSIWIGDKPMMLAHETKGNEAVVKTTTLKNKTRLYITARTRYDDYEDRYEPNATAKGQKEAIKPPIKYTGVALLCYRQNGTRKFYTISKIINRYPHQSYP